MSLPRRILIFGPSGVGKSTLAREIGARLDLPVVHMDALFWEPGWQESTDSVFRERVAKAASADAWVMEGNYTQTLDLRLPRAEAVVLLDLPRSVYFPRAVWRTIKSYGRVRPDIGHGNRERFDKDFLLGWVWTGPLRRPRMLKMMRTLPEHVHGIVLSSRTEVRRFVQTLPHALERPVFNAAKSSTDSAR